MTPRIAIAHDYFTQRGGAERVALAISDAYPQATIYTALYDPAGTFPEVAAKDLRTSWLNKIPLVRKHFRLGLPLFGAAFDHLRVDTATELVITSTTGFAHGIRTAPATKKLVYCHSPARFLYLVDDYLGKPWTRTPVGWVLMALRPWLMAWDRRAANRADVFLCNSTVVRDRIKSVYGIDAHVVHPPQSLDPAGAQQAVATLADWPQFYLIVSRLKPYKNIDKAIEAFAQMPDRRLVVVGKGPLAAQLRAMAPDNVRFLQGLSDDELRWVYAHATAVIAPSKEDYGLTPVEGFSFGRPALALRAGGYLDTVVEATTGWFFDHPSPQAIKDSVRYLESHPLPPEPILDHAQRFTEQAFQSALAEQIDQLLD